MGSGKSTVARILADRLGWDFIDLDAEIELAERATIAEIFEGAASRSSGESNTRRSGRWCGRSNAGCLP